MTIPTPLAYSVTAFLKLRECEVCEQQTGLLRCSSCQIVYCCGRDHQKDDRKYHKDGCASVKNARERLQKEEQKLRGTDVFETGVGHFWEIVETRIYMTARFRMVNHLLDEFGDIGGHALAIETALMHLRDMLRLDRSDNMKARYRIPALYIRLRRDQEAYDFIKWWATTSQLPNYGWGDMQQPYLNMKDADALELPSELWTGTDRIEVSIVVSVLLIKTRLLLDLERALEKVKKDPGFDLQGILDQFHSNIPQFRTEVLIGGAEGITSRIEAIKAQMRVLYKVVDKSSPFYWKSMLDNLSVNSVQWRDAQFPGLDNETCSIIGCNLPSWVESSGSVNENQQTGPRA